MSIAYWIPIRTIGGTKKDKWLECSICGHRINMSDIEELRFSYRDNPDIYINAIKTEYDMCAECKAKMNTNITHQLIDRNIAKGDFHLNEIVENILKNSCNICDNPSLEELFSSCSCELRYHK